MSNRFRVGDIVKIVRYCPDWNGHFGKIMSINGEYHYVNVVIKEEPYNVELEVYGCEIQKTDILDDKLFKI